MSAIEIFGASDDIVVARGLVGGDMTRAEVLDEFDAINGARIEFDDGTILDARFDHEGVWRITVAKRGTALIEKDEIGVDLAFNDDTDYSDRVRLFGVTTVRMIGPAK